MQRAVAVSPVNHAGHRGCCDLKLLERFEWRESIPEPGKHQIQWGRVLHGRDPCLSSCLGIITASLTSLAAKTGFGGGSPCVHCIARDAVMPLQSRVCHRQLHLPPIYRGLKLPSGLETWFKGPGAQMGF